MLFAHVCPSVTMYVCVCTHASYMILHACQLGEQIWSWTQAKNEIAVSRGCVTESGEACIVGSVCEKLLTQIYFWLYNERWNAKGLSWICW